MNDVARVLVVDDDLDICANLSDILTDLGYETDIANDGRSALEFVASRTFDVAVVDFKMAGMDGAALYSEIKKLHSEIVAIMVTAYAGSDGVKRAMDAGTWRVLRKPLDFSLLLELIDAAVKQPLALIVDDDLEFCENLWQILRDSGYRVGVAHEANSAAAHLARRRYHMVLLDLKLTEEDGGEHVFREINGLDSGIHTLLVTGFRAQMETKIERLLENGACGVFYKPIDVQALLNSLHTLAPSSGGN